VVHQPGDTLIAVPTMALLAVVCWQRRRERGWATVGLVLVALAVPFVHLHMLDSAIVALFGVRAAVTVDGVAVVLAWLLLVVIAVRLVSSRRRDPTLAVGAGR
jgi:hypothetical protein